MSQNSLVVANGTGAAVRAALNNALDTLDTLNSGASAPSTTQAYMLWADTTTGLLKIRNAANSAWITIGTLASTYLGLLSLAGGNMTGGINDAKTTVASATTPDIWTGTGFVIDYTGTTTSTGLAAAPQAGARRILICAGASLFTHGANYILPGSANYTSAAGDIIHVVAITTTQFRLSIFKADGTAVVAAPQTGTWSSNLAGSTRAKDTIYRNTSGRKRRVSISFGVTNPGYGDFKVGSSNPPTTLLQEIGQSAGSGSSFCSLAVEVPNNWYYELITGGGTITLINWNELDE